MRHSSLSISNFFDCLLDGWIRMAAALLQAVLFPLVFLVLDE